MTNTTRTPIRPSGRSVYVVRYRKNDRLSVEHRFFLRRHAARRLLTALRKDGREAELYRSAVTWRSA